MSLRKRPRWGLDEAEEEAIIMWDLSVNQSVLILVSSGRGQDEAEMRLRRGREEEANEEADVP